MELTISVITFIIFVISLATWAVLGLVFWIPILTRATTVFSGMILYATLTHQKADAIGQYLRVASGFYANGFRITREALYPPTGSPSPSEIDFRAGRFIVELLWTFGFWLIVLWIGKPDLIKPLTVLLWSAAVWFQQLLTSFQVLTVAIITAVLLLGSWGLYLWNRFEQLSESKERSLKPRASLNEPVQENRIYRDDQARQLKEISRAIQEVRAFLRDFSRSPARSSEYNYPASGVSATALFPIPIDALLRQFRGRTVTVKRDFQNDMLISDSSGKGELVLISDASLEDKNRSLFIVPAVAKFQMRQEYHNFYERYYECTNPQAGAVWIVDPAVVEKVRGGWQLREKGRLEVR